MTAGPSFIGFSWHLVILVFSVTPLKGHLIPFQVVGVGEGACWLQRCDHTHDLRATGDNRPECLRLT